VHGGQVERGGAGGAARCVEGFGLRGQARHVAAFLVRVGAVGFDEAAVLERKG
jgi:hypothetical protein